MDVIYGGSARAPSRLTGNYASPDATIAIDHHPPPPLIHAIPGANPVVWPGQSPTYMIEPIMVKLRGIDEGQVQDLEDKLTDRRDKMLLESRLVNFC